LQKIVDVVARLSMNGVIKRISMSIGSDIYNFCDTSRTIVEMTVKKDNMQDTVSRMRNRGGR
jgi:DNA-binding Lrp family transcriptional regulator